METGYYTRGRVTEARQQRIRKINRETANKTYREKCRIPGNRNAGLQNNRNQGKAYRITGIHTKNLQVATEKCRLKYTRENKCSMRDSGK